MKISSTRAKVENRESSEKQFVSRLSSFDPRQLSAFTLMEIAISLAIIGIALVAIIGVLPLGMRTQRENRELTLINQDATVFIEHIRNGTHGRSETDLANYVFAITNYQTFYNPAPAAPTTTGYDNNGYLADDARIIGLLSTPQFTDSNGQPIPTLLTNLPGGCYSNHIVAYVRSMNGIAIEKPPQGNSTLRESSFSYRILCENVPVQSPLPPSWQSGQTYTNGDKVFYNGIFWKSLISTNTDTPAPLTWARDGYTQTLVDNSRELRLTFQWALLPNNNVGTGRQTFRTIVSGKLAHVVDTNVTPNVNLYFFQPQSYVTNAAAANGPLP